MNTPQDYPIEHVSTLTSKGQITIPIEIRQLLGLQPREKVSFIVHKDTVEMKRKGSVVERTKGMLKSYLPPATAEELRRMAEEAIAESVMERSGM